MVRSIKTAHRVPRRGRLPGLGAVLYAMLHLSGCAPSADLREVQGGVQRTAPLIAVFPTENLTGRPASLEDIRLLLVERLRGQGVRVLDDATLERVITKHRVRYTAGVEQGFARALGQETGAEGILIPSLEAYRELLPPQAALFARLVSTGDAPAVRWADATGAAGDDAPGILGIGLVDDPRVLLEQNVSLLAGSLVRHLSGGSGPVGDRPWARKFGPKIVYRSDVLDPARRYSVAVLPFFNKSATKYAGEILAHHMIRNLVAFPGLDVVEPGILREELLRFRIIMNDGVSLPQTETILNAVNADLVLNGEVLEYQDRRDASGAPSVDFAILFIERQTRRVVYSSYSHNAGNDGVFFFDVGRVNTAHAMASQMARAAVERMLLGPPTGRSAQGAAGQGSRRR